jgi:hypothetical protein
MVAVGPEKQFREVVHCYWKGSQIVLRHSEHAKLAAPLKQLGREGRERVICQQELLQFYKLPNVSWQCSDPISIGVPEVDAEDGSG